MVLTALGAVCFGELRTAALADEQTSAGLVCAALVDGVLGDVVGKLRQAAW